eukprot:jgi/Undpi1/12771/HiC_scaffold_6.g02439.m1
MGRTMGLSAHRYMPGWSVWLKVGWVCLTSLSAVQSMTLDVPEGGESCVIITASEGNIINGNFEVFGNPVKNVMVILRRKADGQLLYKKKGLREDYFKTEARKNGDYEMCFLNGAMNTMEKLDNKDIEKGTRLTGLAALRNERRRKQEEEAKKANQEPAHAFDDDVMGYRTELAGISSDSTSTGSDDLGMWYGYESSTKTIGFGLRLGEDGEDLEAMSDVSEAELFVAKFLVDEANELVQTLSAFNDHESYMRGREEWHSERVKQTSWRLMWCTLLEAAVLVWVSWSQLSYIRRFFETKRAL